jgi:putative glutamine amidotransferase
LIGVSTSEVRVAAQTNPKAESDPRRKELALGLAYLQAIERAGGVPVILAPVPPEGTQALLERLDGLCLSGGPDIHPNAYREPPHDRLGPTEPVLDKFELALARRAHERDLPIFAICRGAQLLNVARGGSLIQHLPDLGSAIEHRQVERNSVVTHAVEVAGDSRLAGLLGSTEIDVNTLHHQAVDRLGEGLRIVARAPDGVVEAIEDPDATFAIGVQWHAEAIVARPEQLALFRAFVAAATGRAERSLARAA